MAENPAAWAVVGVAVKTFFDRHKGKRIQLERNMIVEAANYSAREIERITRALSEVDPNNVEEYQGCKYGESG